MNLIITFFFAVFILLFGLIPFPVLYLFSDFVKFLLQHVAGYRKKVIVQNLKSAFPGISASELKTLVSDTYKNLADITVESFKSFTMSASQIRKRHHILNAELIEHYLRKGKGVIATTAHYNNWEWGSLSPGLFTKFPVIGFYKPLSNKYIDRILQKSRSKYGTTLSSIYKTALTFERNARIPSIYIMAADQSPSNRRKSYWVDFFGLETAFLHGPEMYARLHNLPVVYADVQRVKRGCYTLEVSVIAEDPSILPEGEITRLYAEKLESIIRKNPGSWLWSHKRWKMMKNES